MLNWREIPFFRLLLPLSAGILLAMIFNYNSLLLKALLATLPIVAWAANKVRGMYRYRWLFGSLLNGAVLLLGYQAAWFHLELNQPDHFNRLLRQEEGIVVGRIADAPAKKGDWVKVELATESMGPSPDSLAPVSGNILVYLARDTSAELLRYGDELLFKSNITAIGPPKNPDAFDYGRYLHFQNIHHQAFVREGDWLLHKKRKGFSIYGDAIALQGYFLKTLRKHLSTESELAVGSALILGYRDEVPEDLLTAYSQTGAMHVLAVSGLHVGIVFFIFNFFLGRVKLYSKGWKATKVLLILAGIWIFALVTGASPSVLRATVMFSFINVGMALRRYNNVYNSMAASAFFLLLWNPYWIVSVSFQLSYLAVWGILYFQPKIAKLLTPENKWLEKAWQLIAVSLAAQLMTLPLTLYYFNQFPTWFWLTSMILVPLAGIELGMGLLLLLMESVWEMAAVWVGKALWALLWFGNACVSFIQHLPGAVIEGIWMGPLIALLLYLVILSAMAAIGSKQFKWVFSALAFLVLVSANYAFTTWKEHGNGQIVVYNIYKHTAIDFLDGKKAWSLISRDIGAKALKFAVQGHRMALGIEEVDTLQLSDSLAHASGRFFYENGLVQFHDKKMAIVAQPVSRTGAEKIGVDLLLLRNSPKMGIEELLDIFDSRLIIFDASNKKWQVEKWKVACRELGVEYHDINEQGAWVLDLGDGG
ncbi:MAG: ComEC family competence protein [Lewinellaceae bacterium]|nr:ComEC family competence protein [Lewinellaceae bacterium]